MDTELGVDQGRNGNDTVLVEQAVHGRCETIAILGMTGYVPGFHYQSWLDLGGTVADDWYGEKEWAVGDLPEFSNWADYEAFVAEQEAAEAEKPAESK